MIASLDGGATDDGKAGGLAGTGDRAVFALMREAADVILVGAATVRIENYSGAQLPVAARQARQRRGQAEVPPIAVVTRSGNLDPSALLFTRTEVPPLILTTQPVRRRHPAPARLGGRRHRRFQAGTGLRRPGDGPEDPRRARALPRAHRGRPAVPRHADRERLLDELCLTVAPILVGGGSKRIVTGLGDVHTKMRRTHLLTDDDGYLYSRYVRAD